MISCGVARDSASAVDVALRTQCGRSAWRHQSLNLFPNPFAVNGLPNSVSRNVMLLLTSAAATFTVSAGCNGMSMLIGFRCSQSCDAMNGFAWADKGNGCSLVGLAGTDVLHPLADEVRS